MSVMFRASTMLCIILAMHRLFPLLEGSQLAQHASPDDSPEEFSLTWFCGIYKLLWLIHIEWPFLNQNQPSARLALLGKIYMSKKQNGRQMLHRKLNKSYNFPNKSLRDLILVSNYMFSI